MSKTKKAETTTAPARAPVKRNSIFVSERTREALGVEDSLIPAGPTEIVKGSGLSGRIARVAERFDILVGRARRLTLEQLTLDEREVLLALFRDPYPTRERTSLELIEDVVTRPQDLALAGRLPKAAKALPDKVRAMNDVQRVALVEWIERELQIY